MNILLIEDNKDICKGLEYAFSKENYHLICKNSISESKNYLQENIPNLIILDITLPDGNGINLYKEMLKDLKIPTIFLTAKEDEEVIVECFTLGCDDYITKPFSTKELLARVKRILLRIKENTIIKVQNIAFDLDKMEVSKDGKIIDLTSLELKILSLLFFSIGKVVRRNTILDKIWEWTGNDVSDHTVTVYLKRIREKIGEDIIITVKGIGYRIDEK